MNIWKITHKKLVNNFNRNNYLVYPKCIDLNNLKIYNINMLL